MAVHCHENIIVSIYSYLVLLVYKLLILNDCNDGVFMVSKFLKLFTKLLEKCTRCTYYVG